jgi:hypothetical protein
MQPSLLAEPTDRNIKVVEVAEFGDLAKIVEIAFAVNSAMHERIVLTGRESFRHCQCAKLVGL